MLADEQEIIRCADIRAYTNQAPTHLEVVTSESDFSRAIELAPKRSDLYLARASAYNQIRETDNAIADARLAMQYANNSEAMKEAREWLKYLKAD